MSNRSITGIELFAGAGGLSSGASQAGCSVTHAIEADLWAAKTFKQNHPKTVVIQQDIKSLNADHLQRNSHDLVIFGGAPCQGFSTSNQKNRSSTNEGNWLFLELLRFVRELKPLVVVFENVAGFLQTEKGLFRKALVKNLTELGYHVTESILNASSFGVPQHRKRYFCVACLRFPIELQPGTAKPVSVGQALLDLPALQVGNKVDVLPYPVVARSNYAASLRNGLDRVSGNLVTQNADHIIARYKYVPQGGNWQNIPRELMKSYRNVSNCHTGIYKRLSLDQPSVVLGNFRKNMLIHPTQHRGLSVREAARIQSFEDSFEFCGSIGIQQQQVGNAVPPLLAKGVFTQIMDQLRHPK